MHRELEKGCSQGQKTPDDPRDVSHHMVFHAQHLKQGMKEEGRGIFSGDIRLPKSLLHVIDPSFPRDG